MKLHRLTIIAATLILTICTCATAQTSRSSTPANTSPGASDEQLVGRLVGEVKTGRALIDAQREQNEALKAQLDAGKKNGESLAASYAAASREVEALRTSVDLLQKAVALHEQTITILKNDNDRLKAEAGKQRKRATVATLITIGTIAARVAGF